MGPCVSKNVKPQSQKKEEGQLNLAPEKQNQKISEEQLTSSQKENQEKIKERIDLIKDFQQKIEACIQKYEESTLSLSQIGARYQVYIKLLHKEYLLIEVEKVVQTIQLLQESLDQNDKLTVEDLIKQSDIVLIELKNHQEAKTLEKLDQLSEEKQEVKKHLQDLLLIFKTPLPQQKFFNVINRIEELLGVLESQTLSDEDAKFQEALNLYKQLFDEQTELNQEKETSRVNQISDQNEPNLIDQSPVDFNQQVQYLDQQIAEVRISMIKKVQVAIHIPIAPGGDQEVDEEVDTSDGEVNQDANPEEGQEELKKEQTKEKEIEQDSALAHDQTMELQKHTGENFKITAHSIVKQEEQQLPLL